MLLSDFMVRIKDIVSNDAGTRDNIKLDSIGIHFHIKQFSIANFDLFSNLYFEAQRKI